MKVSSFHDFTQLKSDALPAIGALQIGKNKYTVQWHDGQAPTVKRSDFFSFTTSLIGSKNTELENVRNTLASKTRTGHFFSPFTSPDAVMSVIGKNTMRIAAGKPALEVLLIDPTSKKAFEEQLNNFPKTNPNVFTLAETIDEESKKMGLTPEQFINTGGFSDSERQMFSRAYNQCRAWEQTKINIGLPALTERDKVYVLGHGSAGLDVIAATTDSEGVTLTSRQLVESLIDGGLPQSVVDIRLTACESGDSTTLADFSAQSLAKNKQVKGDAIPLNKRVAAAFHEHDRAMRVTGYHGYGATYPEEHSAERCLEDTHARVKASLLRHIVG